MTRMTTKEIAEDLGIPVQAVRVLAQHEKLPIAAVKMPGSSVYTYYGFKEHLEQWKEGRFMKEGTNEGSREISDQ